MTKKITVHFTPDEWQTIQDAVEALRTDPACASLVPDQPTNAAKVKLALGFLPSKWGNGKHLDGNRPHEREGAALDSQRIQSEGSTLEQAESATD